MKVRKHYVLYFNPITRMAIIGNSTFGYRINCATIGTIIDCSFNDIVHNIKVLSRQGYIISKRYY